MYGRYCVPLWDRYHVDWWAPVRYPDRSSWVRQYIDNGCGWWSATVPDARSQGWTQKPKGVPPAVSAFCWHSPCSSSQAARWWIPCNHLDWPWGWISSAGHCSHPHRWSVVGSQRLWHPSIRYSRSKDPAWAIPSTALQTTRKELVCSNPFYRWGRRSKGQDAVVSLQAESCSATGLPTPKQVRSRHYPQGHPTAAHEAGVLSPLHEATAASPPLVLWYCQNAYF